MPSFAWLIVVVTRDKIAAPSAIWCANLNPIIGTFCLDGRSRKHHAAQGAQYRRLPPTRHACRIDLAAVVSVIMVALALDVDP